ncbi:MAG: GAF domain-containing sensor histidine kinase [Pelolinea sp.]|nr:GAF domain-containing sensor histidine kinase [Pelolinea sp.]
MDEITLPQEMEDTELDGLSDSIQDETTLINAFLLKNIRHILHALADLQELDGLEVFIKLPDGMEVEQLFHAGHLEKIWTAGAYSGSDGLLRKYLLKGEARVINLPNRRTEELSPFLKDKAFGQVLCLPILLRTKPIGIICAAHTRKRFLNDKEMTFFQSVAEWIAGLMDYEFQNQRIRAEIVVEERERIGMDLHDGIIQSLYGIGLSLENTRLGQTNGKKTGVTEIENSINALESAISDIRAYILDLRPRKLRHSNLLEGMKSLIREFRANTMVEVDLTGSPQDVDGLARPQMEALFHIFQESLSNTAKHAHASNVSVRLWRQDDRVMLRVSDDGTGFELSKPDHRIGHGLTNMKARVEAVGGGIEVVSIRKQGTTLRAWMPYIREEEINGCRI